MWLAVVLVAITFAGTVFMIRFLIALLREGAPSVCYWVIPSAAGDNEETAWADTEVDFGFETRNFTSSHANTGFEGWRVMNPWEAGARAVRSNKGEMA
jgi:hypothetical protein